MLLRNLKLSKRYIFITSILMIISLIIIFASSFSNNISYADYETSIVYPTASYYQVYKPTKIVANDEYVVIYDEYDKSIKIFDSNVNYLKQIKCEDINIELLIANDTILVYSNTNYYIANINTDNYLSLLNEANIKNLVSDGCQIYQRLANGSIYIYDSYFNLLYNESNDFFTGTDLLTRCKENIFYIFSHDFYKNKTKFIKFNTAIDNINTISDDNYVYFNETIQNIYLLNNSMLVEINHSLYLYNNTNYLLTLDYEYDYYFGYSDKIYLINNNSLTILNFNQLNNEIKIIDSISNNGSSINYLDNPTSVYATDDTIKITDSNNNRIISIEENEIKEMVLNSKPIKIISSSNGDYVLTNKSELLFINNNTFSSISSLTDIKDIAYLDRLYVLTNNALYTLIGNDFIKIIDINNPYFLANSNYNLLYILCDNKIICIDKIGNLIPYNLEIDLNELYDFKIDEVGNIYFLKENCIEIYSNNITSLNKINTININLDNFIIHPNSFCISKNKIYVTCDESLLLSINYTAPKVNDLINNSCNITENTTTTICKFIDNSSAYYLPLNFNTNEAVKVNDLVFIKINNMCDVLGFSFAIINDQMVLVENSKFESYKNTSIVDQSNKYYLENNSNLYYFPSELSNNYTLNEKIIVEIINYYENINNQNWYSILYENKIYYIQKEYVHLLNNESNYNSIEGKIKSNRIGAKVKVYSDIYFNNIVFEIKDGSKVNVINEFDTYYYILYNNQYGYIAKEYIQFSGLTHLQILAIILAAIIVIISSTVYILIYFTKHKQ